MTVFCETAAFNYEALKADFSNINFDSGFKAYYEFKGPQNRFLLKLVFSLVCFEEYLLELFIVK